MATAKDGLRELRRSHDALAARLTSATDEDLARVSGSSEWTVAQVASHLGSQAEIFDNFVDAGLTGSDPPSQDIFPPIWDEWNARTPRAQAQDSVTANENLLARMEALSDHELAGFRLSMFGMDLDAERFVRMRLSEHALHAWDVAVAFDPSATVAPGSVDLLIDGIGDLASRTGKASANPLVVGITTTEPTREFILDSSGVRLDAAPLEDAATDGTFQMPAEALVRLVYGRISDAHPPQGPVKGEGVELGDLTSIFSGM
jgi:uncharacterized protein (TIGR03083 family)